MENGIKIKPSELKKVGNTRGLSCTPDNKDNKDKLARKRRVEKTLVTGKQGSLFGDVYQPNNNN